MIYHNNILHVYLVCQTRINNKLCKDCTSCKVNGPGKCDPGGCPTKEGTVYVEQYKHCKGNQFLERTYIVC